MENGLYWCRHHRQRSRMKFPVQERNNLGSNRQPSSYRNSWSTVAPDIHAPTARQEAEVCCFHNVKAANGWLKQEKYYSVLWTQIERQRWRKGRALVLPSHLLERGCENFNFCGSECVKESTVWIEKEEWDGKGKKWFLRSKNVSSWKGRGLLMC